MEKSRRVCLGGVGEAETYIMMRASRRGESHLRRIISTGWSSSHPLSTIWKVPRGIYNYEPRNTGSVFLTRDRF